MPEDSDQYCIFVEDVRKRYKNNQIDALDGISFKVEYGKIFGFLGPNGAGKTTINILTTLIRPSSGKVKIFDKDVLKYGLEIRKRIGIVLQQTSFEPCLTVQQSIDLYGLLWGIAARKRRQRVQELLDIFELLSIKDRKIDDLSIGQRRRVQLAREFIHDMDLLFLDEPTVGLDPSARRILLDYIKQQVKNGLTVLFTTHIMEDAEYLCDQIAIIINQGQKCIQGEKLPAK